MLFYITARIIYLLIFYCIKKPALKAGYKLYIFFYYINSMPEKKNATSSAAVSGASEP